MRPLIRSRKSNRAVSRAALASACAGFALLATGSAFAAPEIRLPDEHEGLREEIDRILPDSESGNLIEARRNARDAARRIDQLLRSQGYYAAQIESFAEASEPPQAIVDVRPGPRFMFGSLTFDYSRPLYDPAIAERIRAGAELTSGEPALAEKVVAAEAQAVTRLREAGYPDAQADRRRAVVDHASDKMNVTFNLETARPARYGELVVCEDCNIRPGYFRSFSTFEEGEIYDPEDIQTYSDRIAGTGAFDSVDIKLAEAPEGEGWARRDILVSVEEGRTRTIEAGASYSTSEGIGVETLWTKRNIFGGAETLRLSAKLASLERNLHAELDFPHFFYPDRTFTVLGDVTQEETDAFDRKAATAGVRAEQPITEYIVGTLGAEVEVSRVEDFQTGERDFAILSGLADVRYDDTDDTLDPTEGFRAGVTLAPATGFGDEELVYLRAVTNFSTYKQVSGNPRIVLAGLFRAGTIFGASAADLPADRRFYAGGGGSVRGFPYQGIGPEDAEGDPIGGRSLIEMSAEVRAKLRGRWGGVVFVDAGSVERDGLPGFENLQTGAGVGVRYHTDFGPIRGDVAFPLSGGDGVQIYLSIGQAF